MSDSVTADLISKLEEVGVEADSPSEEKILALWKLYLSSEVNLKQQIQTLTKCRDQQALEMREVEKYVEHIRKLSDEREALTKELEIENERLKTDHERLKSSHVDVSADEAVKDMLRQQDLTEIVDSPTVEQIAFLLMERAKLLDELDEMKENKEDQLKSKSDQLALHAANTKIADLESELRWLQEKRTEKSSSENLNADLRLEIQQIRRSLNDKNCELETLAKEKHLLSDRKDAIINRLQSEIRDKTTEIGKLRAELTNAKFDDKTPALSSELCSLRDALAAREAEIAHLKQVNVELDAKIMLLNEDKERHTTTRAGYQVELIEFEHNVSELKSELSAKETFIRSLMEEIAGLNSKIDEASFEEKQSADPDKKYQLLQNELHHKNSYLRRIKQESELLRTDLQSCRSQLEAAVLAQNGEKRDSDALRSKLEVIEEELGSVNREHEQHANDFDLKITSLETEREGLKHQLIILQTDKDDLKRAHQKLINESQKEITQLKCQLTELRTSSSGTEANLSDQVNSSHKTIEKMEAEIEIQRRQSTEAEAAKTEALKQLSNVHSQLREAEEKATRLEERLSGINNSTERSTERIQTLQSENALLQTKLAEAMVITSKSNRTGENLITPELHALRDENKQLKADLARAQNHVSGSGKAKVTSEPNPKAESLVRTNLEERNTFLEKEFEIVCEKLQELQVKFAALQISNDDHCAVSGQSRNAFCSSNEASCQATPEVESLEIEVDTLRAKLSAVEGQAEKVADVQVEVARLRNDNLILKRDLANEQESRSRDVGLANKYRSRITELEKSGNESFEEITNLQHQLVDVNAKLEQSIKLKKSFDDMQTASKHELATLEENLSTAKENCDVLKLELELAKNQYTNLQRHHHIKKARAKMKLSCAKELITKERHEFEEQLSNLRHSLQCAESRLENELSWKDRINQECKSISEQKLQLLEKFEEQSDQCRQKNRRLVVLDGKLKLIEAENNHLREQISQLKSTNSHLERQLSNHREIQDRPNFFLSGLDEFTQGQLSELLSKDNSFFPHLPPRFSPTGIPSALADDN